MPTPPPVKTSTPDAAKDGEQQSQTGAAHPYRVAGRKDMQVRPCTTGCSRAVKSCRQISLAGPFNRLRCSAEHRRKAPLAPGPHTAGLPGRWGGSRDPWQQWRPGGAPAWLAVAAEAEAVHGCRSGAVAGDCWLPCTMHRARARCKTLSPENNSTSRSAYVAGLLCVQIIVQQTSVTFKAQCSPTLHKCYAASFSTQLHPTKVACCRGPLVQLPTPQ